MSALSVGAWKCGNTEVSLILQSVRHSWAKDHWKEGGELELFPFLPFCDTLGLEWSSATTSHWVGGDRPHTSHRILTVAQG